MGSATKSKSAPGNILVIKLGAFGDFIQALGLMAAIRRHHPKARLTLLTTPPFAGLARQSGYFDEVWIDERPSWYQISKAYGLWRRINNAEFDRVYDLQNNDRTQIYFRAMRPKPQWVGSARGASHYYDPEKRKAEHAFDAHVQTLALAGINNVEIDRLDWLRSDISGFLLSRPYVLIVPGCAPSRPGKRWPAEHFAALAGDLSKNGIRPAILGQAHENSLGQIITDICPEALNLCGKTSIADLASLARGAAMAVGNDTGPMHLIAATGCPVTVLFSGSSNPERHRPKGPDVNVIRKSDLSLLSPEEVRKHLGPFQESGPSSVPQIP